MKKEYIAPDLYFEPYELSQSIAAGCNTGITAIANEWGLFTSTSAYKTLDACSVIISNDEDLQNYYESYCYWQGTGNYQLFTS